MGVNEKFASIVKSRRAELGLSQRQVAKMTHGVVTFAALSRIENGHRVTRGQSLSTVYALAKVLRLRVIVEPTGLRVERLD